MFKGRSKSRAEKAISNLIEFLVASKTTSPDLFCDLSRVGMNKDLVNY